MGGFTDPILGGGRDLIRPEMQSPDYQRGIRGWQIRKDGTAEFNNLTSRGSVIVQSPDGGVFVYRGTPALGNMVISITDAAGTDPQGNDYGDGINVYGTDGRAVINLRTFADGSAGILYSPGGTEISETLITDQGAGLLQILGPSADPDDGFANLIFQSDRTAYPPNGSPRTFGRLYTDSDMHVEGHLESALGIKGPFGRENRGVDFDNDAYNFDASGAAIIAHSLGVVPSAVLVTAENPDINMGANLFTATTFQVRATNTANQTRELSWWAIV